MLLNKYCLKEHNVKNCDFLQIGTLNKFRNIENEELLDKNEGIYEYELNFKNPIELDMDIASIIFSGIIGFGSKSQINRPPGSIKCFIKELSFDNISESKVLIKKADVIITREYPNCYIFCMSKQNEVDISTFKMYNDCWSITSENINGLIEYINSSLFNNLKIGDSNDFKIENSSIPDIKNLLIYTRHSEVKYIDNKISFDETSIRNSDIINDILYNIPFIKPKKYIKENEYRFIFEISDRKMLYPPIKNEILLPLKPIAPILA